MAITVTSLPMGDLCNGVIVVFNMRHIHTFFIIYEIPSKVVNYMYFQKYVDILHNV